MPNLSGTIYRQGTKERLPGALVKVSAKGKADKIDTADDDGNFALDLAPGSWSVVAMHEDSFPSVIYSIDLVEDKSGFDIYLPRMCGIEDAKSGKILFWTLVGLLISLVIVYIIVHLFIPSGRVDNFQFWSDSPRRYLEILLWGFGGILVNKLIMIGWWLRNQRFYREGIIMHISHLLVTPLMVLVVTLLLSLVTFNITLADNTLTLDLTKPEVMISLAFILGTIPWSLWSFIEDAGKRFSESKDKIKVG